MNQVKFKTTYKSLTSIAKKVFDAIPITLPATSYAISTEMRRQGVGSPDFSIVKGCLNSLVEVGLIREVSKDHFCRVEVRCSSGPVTIITAPDTPKEKMKTVPAAVVPAAVVPAAVATAPVGQVDPIDTLAELANSALAIAASMTALAKQIEGAALDISEQGQKNREATQKLKQLQSLLTSI